MTATLLDKLATADDLLNLGPDFHGELVEGRIIEMAPASWEHGLSGGQALFLLKQFVDTHKLGRVFTAETGFILKRDPDLVRAPDVAFVRSGRVPAERGRGGFFDGPPDLAVEIVSPGDRLVEVERKIDDFLTAGCLSVWIISPVRRTITLHRPARDPGVLREGETLSDEGVLPGFAVAVARFFEQ